MIAALRLKAAHDHNLKVIREGKGEVILLRRLNSTQDKTLDVSKYGPCPCCLGWVLLTSIKRHQSMCHKQRDIASHSKSGLLLQSNILSGKVSQEASPALQKEVFSIMQTDDISQIAKTDNLIIQLGNESMLRNRGNHIMRRYYTSSTMRLASRLKLACRDVSGINANMEEFLQPAHFDTVVKAALQCCNVNELDEEDLKAPSNAIKLGHDVHRMTSAKLASAIMACDDEKMKEADEFLKLMKLQWGLRVTKLARSLLNERSFNQRVDLPLPSDIKKLSNFLQKEISDLDLGNGSYSNFRKTAVLTLARLTLFNRRTCHEVQAMRLDSYALRKKGIDEVGLELRGELTEFEMKLLTTQEMVVIRGKTGRGVPVIIPQDVRRALHFLTDKGVRQTAGVPSCSPYVFSNARDSVFRAYDAINEITQDPDAGLECPRLVRTTKLRKYMATMLQVLNTSDAERQWVVDHLGHTMDVHQVHYRQTSDVLERVDVAKILLIQDLGIVGKFKGKRLEDIDLNEIMEDVPVEREQTVDRPVIPEALDMPQEYGDDEGPPTKRRRTSRQKWSQEEIDELVLLFCDDFKTGKLPGQKKIESVMRKSEKRQGHIFKRKRDTIKKKLSNMMLKERRGTNSS